MQVEVEAQAVILKAKSHKLHRNPHSKSSEFIFTLKKIQASYFLEYSKTSRNLFFGKIPFLSKNKFSNLLQCILTKRKLLKPFDTSDLNKQQKCSSVFKCFKCLFKLSCFQGLSLCYLTFELHKERKKTIEKDRKKRKKKKEQVKEILGLINTWNRNEQQSLFQCRFVRKPHGLQARKREVPFFKIMPPFSCSTYLNNHGVNILRWKKIISWFVFENRNVLYCHRVIWI